MASRDSQQNAYHPLMTGTVLGGPELEGTELDLIVNKVLRAVTALTVSPAPELAGRVGICVYLPGSIWGFNTSELTRNTLSARRREVGYNLVIPREFAPGVRPEQHLYSRIREAVRLGADEFTRLKIPFDWKSVDKALEQMERKTTLRA